MRDHRVGRVTFGESISGTKPGGSAPTEPPPSLCRSVTRLEAIRELAEAAQRKPEAQGWPMLILSWVEAVAAGRMAPEEALARYRRRLAPPAPIPGQTTIEEALDGRQED